MRANVLVMDRLARLPEGGGGEGLFGVIAAGDMAWGKEVHILGVLREEKAYKSVIRKTV